MCVSVTTREFQKIIFVKLFKKMPKRSATQFETTVDFFGKASAQSEAAFKDCYMVGPVVNIAVSAVNPRGQPSPEKLHSSGIPT
ncbi:hypothetical protein SFRURICE_020870 [Spodoptera frugiperda]|nr:hypothetical protein SFRURICE_020870 [Spodoptera frugiperda]